jgi:pimeloyl-ACP methyl ester carboxylesterase
MAMTAALLVLLVSCTSPGVKRLNKPQAETVNLEVLLNPRQLTESSRRYLSEQGLHDAYQDSAVAVIEDLHKRLAQEPSLALRLTLMELCADQGGLQEKSDAYRAVGFYLAAAELAAAEVRDAVELADISTQTQAVYNHSAGRVARLLVDDDYSWEEAQSFNGPWSAYRLTTPTTDDALTDPKLFDELESAAYIKLKHTDVERITVEGFGAAMVAYRKTSAEHMKGNPFMSPLGMAAPVNATLDFSAGDGGVELAFHDLTVVEEAALGGRTVPLAADLTAPLVVPFNNFEERNIAWKGLVHPDDYIDYMKLYQLDPFQPEKIPLILVHGLLSSPHIWISVFNALNADPQLRERYQLYVFLYPTGFPIGYSAAALRHRLAQFQDYFDPDRSNPNMQNVILFGHSMGGVLSSMQIRSTTEAYERTFFTMPIDALAGIDGEQKAALKALLNYQASPNITRTVFIAAPHRGSEAASGLRGSIGSALITDPTETVLTQPLPPIDGLTDAGHYMVEHRLNGIESLVPNNPALLAVLEQPIREGVTFHSLIGQKDPKVPLEQGSDGTVPYWSSHLDGAASETVINDKHTPLVKNEGTIEELRRLLYLHADLAYQPKL